MFVYKGMPDMYRYDRDGESYYVFWHEGEFYLHDRLWNYKESPQSEEFRYFDSSDELLEAMLDIAPWKDWKLHNTPEVA